MNDVAPFLLIGILLYTSCILVRLIMLGMFEDIRWERDRSWSLSRLAIRSFDELGRGTLMIRIPRVVLIVFTRGYLTFGQVQRRCGGDHGEAVRLWREFEVAQGQGVSDG